MSHKDLWIAVLERLHPTIKRQDFLTWFNRTALASIDGEKAVIAGPTSFLISNLAKYELKILQALQEKEATIKSIEFVIRESLLEPENPDAVNPLSLVESEEKKVRKVKNLNEVTVRKGGGEKINSQMLNSRYRLSNYIVGHENRLPHAASQAVAAMPGGIYNPLYIYGSVGLGKTHLLQSIGNEILKNFPDMVVQYVTAERFVTEVVEAISKRYTQKFKDKYRKVDCFLIDDIQFFARKNSSQQEFFHTINELTDWNKQVVITSDRPPEELDDIDERIKSRCGMGMVVELLMPDFETRVAILQEKCKELQLLIDPEVLQFIANNITDSVRQLEGVLKQVMADMQLCHRTPTIRSVAEIIKRMNRAKEIIGYDLEAGAVSRAKTAEDVMRVVAEYYHVELDDLVGKERHRQIMLPRQLCMYLIKNELGDSYEKIGVNFGGRNHTTVMNACNKTAARLKDDLRLVRDINAIKREMGL